MQPVTPPRERACLRCDRKEVWSDAQRTWVAKTDGDTAFRGTPHCVHEWDITGNFNPFESES